jgi:cellulose synthase/poly-beta-1,6-N-acetylglucosamine synthase-like glycosyltransferase
MPTVLLNAVLSAVRRNGFTVRAPDRVAVVSPMYNEERGAERALTSVLGQSEPPEQLVVSINGGSDDTEGVVRALLIRKGYRCEQRGPLEGANADLERWSGPEGGTEVTLALFADQTAKSDSLNLLVERVVATERVLVIDGDTVLERRFLEVMRRSLYRLVLRDGAYILVDDALQSGAVMSYAPRGSGPLQRLISLARRAEYAFAGILRRGQTATFGRWDVFARSRLFTVVGCGFVVRRDRFPIPNDTMTEDHDFTLAVQSREPVSERCGVAELDARGFRVVQGGRETPLSALVGFARTVELRHSSDARFVGEAVMLTEDPPHLNGLFRQVERWNGGSIESVLKRALRPEERRAMSPNVRFALWTSLFEQLLGLLLLMLLPILVALNLGSPSFGMPWRTLLAWLGFDLAFGALLTGYGFLRYHLAARRPAGRALLRAAGDLLVSLLPFMVLKYLNPVAYLAGALQILPRRRRLSGRDRVAGVAWERPAAAARARTPLMMRWLVLVTGVTVLSAAQVSATIDPVNRGAWLLMEEAPRVEMASFQSLPALVAAPPEARRREVGLSRHCTPAEMRWVDRTPRHLADGAPQYTPLTTWGLLTLARLAPIAPLLEEAATAYDVPPRFLLQVLLNESYLDPLAEGPTGDLGLSQMTSDALTMLKALSSDARSPLFNPRLISEDLNVFDPDFSLCAGAAKLAWARTQSGGSDDGVAYALYINPLRGAPRGTPAPRHGPAIAAMLHLEGLAGQLQAVYDADPARLTPAERDLRTLSVRVATGELALADGYALGLELALEYGIDDAMLYRRVLAELFPSPPQREVETAAIR